jgi:hypothetical protein
VAFSSESRVLNPLGPWSWSVAVMVQRSLSIWGRKPDSVTRAGHDARVAIGQGEVHGGRGAAKAGGFGLGGGAGGGFVGVDAFEAAAVGAAGGHGLAVARILIVPLGFGAVLGFFAGGAMRRSRIAGA